MTRADSNGDGRISRQEYMSQPYRLFDALDTDHNGVVTQAEQQAARQKHAAGKHGAGNLLGIHESSDKALKIMIATTVMAVVMLIWSGVTLASRGPVNPIPSWQHDLSKKTDVDDQGRMLPAALESALAYSSGPTLVVLQAGNLHSGACDPFAELAAVAHEHGAWVHVDGAFGLWAAASPRLATYRWSPAIPMLSGWSPPEANTPTRSSFPLGRIRNAVTESLPWLTA